MPALYPAKPWSRGVPPSTSGQLEKCGIGLSLRWRGEKPVDPCLGRCSFGIRHPSAESGLSSRTMSRGRSVATPWRCLQGQKDRARISGIHGGIARERLVDALGRPYGGAVYNSLEREGCASSETRVPASRSIVSTDERLRLRFLRLGNLEDERLNDRLVFFLVDFLFVRFCERPPERFHPRVVVFVTHRRAFVVDIAVEIQNTSPFRLPEENRVRAQDCTVAVPQIARGIGFGGKENANGPTGTICYMRRGQRFLRQRCSACPPHERSCREVASMKASRKHTSSQVRASASARLGSFPS